MARDQPARSVAALSCRNLCSCEAVITGFEPCHPRVHTPCGAVRRHQTFFSRDISPQSTDAPATTVRAVNDSMKRSATGQRAPCRSPQSRHCPMPRLPQQRAAFILQQVSCGYRCQHQYLHSMVKPLLSMVSHYSPVQCARALQAAAQAPCLAQTLLWNNSTEYKMTIDAECAICHEEEMRGGWAALECGHVFHHR